MPIHTYKPLQIYTFGERGSAAKHAYLGIVKNNRIFANVSQSSEVFHFETDKDKEKRIGWVLWKVPRLYDSYVKTRLTGSYAGKAEFENVVKEYENWSKKHCPWEEANKVRGVRKLWEAWKATNTTTDDESEEDEDELTRVLKALEKQNQKSTTTKKSDASKLLAPPDYEIHKRDPKRYITEVVEWIGLVRRYLTDDEIYYAFREKTKNEEMLEFLQEKFTSLEEPVTELEGFLMPAQVAQAVKAFGEVVTTDGIYSEPGGPKIWTRKFKNKLDELEAQGCTMSEQAAGVIMLFSAQLKESDTTNLFTALGDDFKLENVRKKLESVLLTLPAAGATIFNFGTQQKQTSTGGKCSHCGKEGHQVGECWSKNPELLPEWIRNKPKEKGKGKKQKKTDLTCGYCKKPGHEGKNCIQKQNAEKKKAKQQQQ